MSTWLPLGMMIACFVVVAVFIYVIGRSEADINSRGVNLGMAGAAAFTAFGMVFMVWAAALTDHHLREHCHSLGGKPINGHCYVGTNGQVTEIDA